MDSATQYSKKRGWGVGGNIRNVSKEARVQKGKDNSRMTICYMHMHPPE